MKSEEFKELFKSEVRRAIENARQAHGKAFPNSAWIELHAFGYHDTLVSVDEAASLLFVSESEFFRIIDLAVIAETSESSIIFARPSGHPPGRWEQTWDPSSTGPFKQIESEAVTKR